MTRDVFLQQMRILGATFDRKVSPEATEGYWKALSWVGDDAFRVAVDRALGDSRFMPSPAQLRTAAREAIANASLAAQSAKVARCHFHGDGEFEPLGIARPDTPSTNHTVWWCDRCTYFVGMGLQQPDRAARGAGAVDVVRKLADGKDGAR